MTYVFIGIVAVSGYFWWVLKASLWNFYLKFQYEDDFWPTRIPTTKSLADRHGCRIFKYGYTHHNSSSRDFPSNLFVHFDRRCRHAAVFFHGLACCCFRNGQKNMKKRKEMAFLTRLKASLLSKFTPQHFQSSIQGVRIGVETLATILAPLWISSTINISIYACFSIPVSYFNQNLRTRISDVYTNNWLHTNYLIISCSRAVEDRFLPSAEPDFKRWQQKRRRWAC